MAPWWDVLTLQIRYPMCVIRQELLGSSHSSWMLPTVLALDPSIQLISCLIFALTERKNQTRLKDKYRSAEGKECDRVDHVM